VPVNNKITGGKERWAAQQTSIAGSRVAPVYPRDLVIPDSTVAGRDATDKNGIKRRPRAYPRSGDTRGRVPPRARCLSLSLSLSPSRIGPACIVYPRMDDKTGSPLTARGKLAGCLMSLLVTIPLYVAERRARIEIKVRSHSASWPVPSPATCSAASSISSISSISF